SRQADIEQNDVRAEVCRRGKRCATIVHVPNIMAELLEQRGKRAHEIAVVVDDEQASPRAMTLTTWPREWGRIRHRPRRTAGKSDDKFAPFAGALAHCRHRAAVHFYHPAHNCKPDSHTT